MQCGRGNVIHPTRGPGLTACDLPTFSKLAGKVTDIEFHCCLVARMGPCFESGQHAAYDGNAFCFQLAQRTKARVKASLHLQWGAGNEDCGWAGAVFTWNPKGQIVARVDYPINPEFCVDR